LQVNAPRSELNCEENKIVDHTQCVNMSDCDMMTCDS
jgi:hypothetical protein